LTLARHLHRIKKSPSPVCAACAHARQNSRPLLSILPCNDDSRHLLPASNPLASFTKHLLTDPTILPDLFKYIQCTGRIHSIFGDFKTLEW
ncbi:hypothetical protein C8R44DRAFT_543172, partial [Mycena epipterygia]